MPTPLPGLPGTGGSNTAYGLVPQVPDPNASAAAAITGDLANLPSLESLAGQTNAFNTQQAINPYIANLPGYSQMVAQSSGNIGSLLQGQIPPDVLNLLSQQGAERGIATGLAGSPNANAATMRALGLTSLGLQQQGEGELTNAIGRTPVPQLFNTAQFMTTPGDEQAAQMQANIYAAAPNPNMQAQALLDLFNRFSSRFAGNGGVTIDRGLGGGVQTNPNTGSSNAGASGGGRVGAGVQQIHPGVSVNTNSIFGQNMAGGMPPITLGGYGQQGNQDQQGMQDLLGSGMISPDFLTGQAGGSQQLNDINSPLYQWWNQGNPYDALSGINWGAPTDFGSNPAIPNDIAQQTSPNYNWWSQTDPYASLSGINWAQPTFFDQLNQGVITPEPTSFTDFNDFTHW